jgi:hypothetical protein
LCCSRLCAFSCADFIRSIFGESIFELLQKHNRYFIDEHQKKIHFDGDTIEFVTQDFYKKDVDSVIAELNTIKKEFTENLQQLLYKENIFSQFGNIKICSENHPLQYLFLIMKNYSVFNMTYHFNLTIPTELNKDGEIKDRFYKKTPYAYSSG